MKLFKPALVLFAGLMGAASANAGLITKTNSTGGVVDASSMTQIITITAADIAGMVDSVLDVNLTVDFSKCGASATLAGCTGGSSFTFNGEIIFDLAHGAATSVVGPDTFSGQSTNARVTQTYDDEAATAVGGGVLLSGTFSPVSALSAQDGVSALGDWSFTFADVAGADPLVVHSWRLDIELRDQGQIPVPAPLALLGLGLVAMGWSRRKRA